MRRALAVGLSLPLAVRLPLRLALCLRLALRLHLRLVAMAMLLALSLALALRTARMLPGRRTDRVAAIVVVASAMPASRVRVAAIVVVASAMRAAAVLLEAERLSALRPARLGLRGNVALAIRPAVADVVLDHDAVRLLLRDDAIADVVVDVRLALLVLARGIGSGGADVVERGVRGLVLRVFTGRGLVHPGA